MSKQAPLFPVSGDLIILSAMFDAHAKGTHEITDDGWRVFGERLNEVTQRAMRLDDAATAAGLFAAGTLDEQAMIETLDRDAKDRDAGARNANDNVVRFPGASSKREEDEAVNALARSLIGDAGGNDGDAA